MANSALVCRLSIVVLSFLTGCQSAPPVPNSATTPGGQNWENTSAAIDTTQKQASTPAGDQARSNEGTGNTAPPGLLDFENNVYFQLGKTGIDDQGIETLTKHAERLKSNAKLHVTLIGHTDNLGSPAYNQAISDARLSAVLKILIDQGVARRQIRRISLGNEHRSALRCRTDECRQKLRRVELSYGPSR